MIDRCAAAALTVAVLAACAPAGRPPQVPMAAHATGRAEKAGRPDAAEAATDVYAADRPGMFSPVVKDFPSRVYVPNSESGTVSVINPHTYRVVRQFRVGRIPQHVVPSWDLRTLWVNNNAGNSLTPIDPRTARPGKPIRVPDPYNLYFAPDGSTAIVMAEALHELDFRDPHTMRLQHRLRAPCKGINHGDFTADGSLFLVSCEFSGRLLVVDWRRPTVTHVIDLRGGTPMPQDVKLSPDGTVFYVADMWRGGVWLIDAGTFRVLRFLHTGDGAHGLYVSRDSRVLYVSDRGAGQVSVISFATQSVVARWRIPGGGSPDMGGVSADGRQLWLTGRYHGVVYVFSTQTGKVLHTIRVGQGPHGLCVYPQPGRYSLGHTGIFR